MSSVAATAVMATGVNYCVTMLSMQLRVWPCLVAILCAQLTTIDSTPRTKFSSENEYDVQQLHHSSYDSSSSSSSRSSSDIVGRYASYDEIVLWQLALSHEHPDIVKLFDIGKTYEGRPMKLLKLGTHDDKRNKWSIWLDGGIHAREHITPASIVYIADQLVRSYLSSSADARWLLEHIDWYLLPVLNPDGYEFSRTREGRMWRKNRRPITENCTGVDLNRNWNIAWGGADSDRDPCSDQFMGERPETEPEVTNVVDFVLPRAEQFIAFVTFHSYGQRIMTRWDHTSSELPEDHPQLMYLANKMALAMQQPYDTEYESGVASQLSYAFGGGSADWARSVAKIRYSYLIELRDRHGFQLPVDQVIPTGRESWAAVRELAAHVLFNDGFTRPCRDQLRHHYRRREPESRLPCSELVDVEEPTSSAVHEALVNDDPMTSSNNGGCQLRTFISGGLVVFAALFAVCNIVRFKL